MVSLMLSYRLKLTPVYFLLMHVVPVGQPVVYPHSAVPSVEMARGWGETQGSCSNAAVETLRQQAVPWRPWVTA